MAFRRTRQSVDRYVRDGQYWRERKTPEQIKAEIEEAKARTDVAIAEIRQQPVKVRREHPVITERIYTTPYQVLRRAITRDGLELEVIGETRTLREALTISTAEQWAAIIIDRNGKQVSFNGQPELRRA